MGIFTCISGVVRFRDRVYKVINRAHTKKEPQGKLLREMNKIIKKVSSDIDTMSFNTAISALMVYTNLLTAMEEDIPYQALETLALLVSPFAPHLAEECWSILGHKDSLAYHAWPTYDEQLCVDSTAVIGIQINGKVRATIEMEKAISESDAIDLAKQNAQVMKYIQDKPFKKVIYVPGRILNFIV